MKKIKTYAPAYYPAAIFFLIFSNSIFAEISDNKLDTYLQSIDTFSAAFEQKIFNEYGELLEKSVGVVYLRRPGMFHWSYWEPYSQQIISDGITLWVYDEDLEQVTVRDVVNSIDDTPAMILSGDTRLYDHFVLIDLGQAEGVEWYELTPRNEDSEYNSFRLGFRDKELSAMLLFDNLGQKTQIKFLNTKRNPVIQRGQFQFSPPDGIDVIDGREQ